MFASVAYGLSSNGYEHGWIVDLRAVPEPSSGLLRVLVTFAILTTRRRPTISVAHPRGLVNLTIQGEALLGRKRYEEAERAIAAYLNQALHPAHAIGRFFESSITPRDCNAALRIKTDRKQRWTWR